jgi:hypothetical protein
VKGEGFFSGRIRRRGLRAQREAEYPARPRWRHPLARVPVPLHAAPEADARHDRGEGLAVTVGQAHPRLDGARRPPHRPVPQPGGFEGFVGIEVFANPDRLPVPELAQPGDGRFGFRATFPAAPPEAADRNDLLAEGPDLRQLDLRLLGESLVGLALELEVSLVSRLKASIARPTASTFSSDIAYSRSPAASRASASRWSGTEPRCLSERARMITERAARA